jgi:hypothetical protein
MHEKGCSRIFASFETERIKISSNAAEKSAKAFSGIKKVSGHDNSKTRHHRYIGFCTIDH